MSTTTEACPPAYYFSALDEPTQQAMRLKLIALNEPDFVRSQQKYKLARDQLELAANGGSPYAVYILASSYWYGGWGQYYDPVKASNYIKLIKDPVARQMLYPDAKIITHEMAQTAFKNGNFIPMEILATNFRINSEFPELRILCKLGSIASFEQLHTNIICASEFVNSQVKGMGNSCMLLFVIQNTRNLIKLRKMLLVVVPDSAEDYFDDILDKALNIEKSTLMSSFDRLIGRFPRELITVYFIGSDSNKQRRCEHERKLEIADTRPLFLWYKKRMQAPIITWLCCAKHLHICKDIAVMIAKIVFAKRHDVLIRE